MQWQVNFLNLTRRTEIGFHLINKITSIVASIALGVMMLVTVIDVIGRYFFNKPITGTPELVGLLLVCAGTWGWGYCQMEKGHVSVTVLTERLPPRAQVGLRIFAYLIGLAGFSLICWRILLRTINYISIPRGGITDILKLPYWPFMLALTISSGLLALIILIDLLHSIVEVTRKNERN